MSLFEEALAGRITEISPKFDMDKNDPECRTRTKKNTALIVSALRDALEDIGDIAGACAIRVMCDLSEIEEPRRITRKEYIPRDLNKLPCDEVEEAQGQGPSDPSGVLGRCKNHGK